MLHVSAKPARQRDRIYRATARSSVTHYCLTDRDLSVNVWRLVLVSSRLAGVVRFAAAASFPLMAQGLSMLKVLISNWSRPQEHQLALALSLLIVTAGPLMEFIIESGYDAHRSVDLCNHQLFQHPGEREPFRYV